MATATFMGYFEPCRTHGGRRRRRRGRREIWIPAVSVHPQQSTRLEQGNPPRSGRPATSTSAACTNCTKGQWRDGQATRRLRGQQTIKWQFKTHLERIIDNESNMIFIFLFLQLS